MILRQHRNDFIFLYSNNITQYVETKHFTRGGLSKQLRCRVIIIKIIIASLLVPGDPGRLGTRISKVWKPRAEIIFEQVAGMGTHWP
jgi:hypothetical protein